MNVTELMSTPEAERGFYPTPPEVADKLLSGIDWFKIGTVLEPSAGKGNLVHAVLEKYSMRYGGSSLEIDVDCVEIDPNLRAILDYEFGAKKRNSLYKEKEMLEKKHVWDRESDRYLELPPEEKCRLGAVMSEIHTLDSGNVRIVHDDFLSMNTWKRYDLIVMNPPFSNGDAHLLKAIQMQQYGGGEIRCVLNAETIRNPFSKSRRLLLEKLLDMDASITYMQDAFSAAERKTGVEIALISISVPAAHKESEIFDRLKKANAVKEAEQKDVTDMTVADFMERVVTQYRVECEAGAELIREYEAMKPYIQDSFDKDNKYSTPTLSLCVGDPSRTYRGDTPSINKFLRLTRLKYWEALFSNKEFSGRLTSKLLEKYRSKIAELADYDFSLFNIQAIAAKMNSEMGKGIEDTIVELFDKMTVQYSYYPEMEKNIHYYNGWKTNKVHKINNKVILPICGVFADRYWSKDTFNVRAAEETIGDIEKVFDYLDGDMTAPISLHGALQRACEAGQTRNIPCKFFDVTLYKKGTMHIRFHNQDLVDRFNIYCCRKKNWLPPNYGKVSYSDMAAEEQAVIDGFHGDGSSESGCTLYAKVMERAQYYLSEPTREVPLLSSGA